ncbi:hypothetical protein VOLCADRAFT_93617 [Volvox carteri f. nagariensis]|uniref:Uncharacterized protein n=1 Tax=Volvox carteri f. nagariensis TaxID=3068 RepID=D8U2K9_VOLCA|nr:uncharacterized protein VOLCADRAFT_93617 [Volvox carteri f. nagariensis]EFJ46078.1 hypothetical protein VOLCADRAFT_93617 [Volvox carteri f. nagariensis]|eukprot:XP_002952828.1 hypothetical protein VOLCADRAFT_93617 [Volvox carteri f. nagariensis]
MTVRLKVARFGGVRDLRPLGHPGPYNNSTNRLLAGLYEHRGLRSFQARTTILQIGSSPDCMSTEVLVAGQVLTGVYDPARRHLTVPCTVSSKLYDQPEAVKALVCRCYTIVGAATEFVALLAAEGGATILLPREGASNASEIRVRADTADDEVAVTAENSVAFAHGPDPYIALQDAVRLLAKKAGAQFKDVQAYVLPVLDAANRLRFDAPLAPLKSSAMLSSSASLTAMLEQQLHEGILVQAGPGCPAKPLLQAPCLRVCQGLGLRYSGMSVVYGTATGQVLAVMETAAALKMAPVGGLRPWGSTVSLGRLCSGADSPSAVSAGASAATSTTPSPNLSRANSSHGDAAVVDALESLTINPPVASTPRPTTLVLSGRSITAAPIINVQAAAPLASGNCNDGSRAGGLVASSTTPTGAPAQVLASFALLGFKTAGGRIAAVQRCRIMPAAAVLSTLARPDETAAATASVLGLGIVIQVEVSSTTSGALLLFIEGSEADEFDAEVPAAGPVRRVLSQGKEARWRYNAGSILCVELPAVSGAQREVQIFL